MHWGRDRKILWPIVLMSEASISQIRVEGFGNLGTCAVRLSTRSARLCIYYFEFFTYEPNPRILPRTLNAIRQRVGGEAGSRRYFCRSPSKPYQATIAKATCQRRTRIGRLPLWPGSASGFDARRARQPEVSEFSRCLSGTC